MVRGGYRIDNTAGIHFVTFAVVGWVDVFMREDYRQILVDSLRYCQANKGLQIYSWCIMSNHVHLLIGADHCDTSDILRDFKKFTAKAILKAIKENPRESRWWMLALFKKKGNANIRNSMYQFWQQSNCPKEVFSEHFTRQKLEYIHNNPVKAGLVRRAEDYVYSSAIDYYEGKNVGGLLEVLFIN